MLVMAGMIRLLRPSACVHSQVASRAGCVGLIFTQPRRAQSREKFNGDLELAFFDTTSTYFEGRSLKGWARLGKSKDHRPDHLQLVVGVLMRRDGLPVACEIWPGNTADVTTLVPISL